MNELKGVGERKVCLNVSESEAFREQFIKEEELAFRSKQMKLTVEPLEHLWNMDPKKEPPLRFGKSCGYDKNATSDHFPLAEGSPKRVAPGVLASSALAERRRKVVSNLGKRPSRRPSRNNVTSEDHPLATGLDTRRKLGPSVPSRPPTHGSKLSGAGRALMGSSSAPALSKASSARVSARLSRMSARSGASGPAFSIASGRSSASRATGRTNQSSRSSRSGHSRITGRSSTSKVADSSRSLTSAIIHELRDRKQMLMAELNDLSALEKEAVQFRLEHPSARTITARTSAR